MRAQRRRHAMKWTASRKKNIRGGRGGSCTVLPMWGPSERKLMLHTARAVRASTPGYCWQSSGASCMGSAACRPQLPATLLSQCKAVFRAAPRAPAAPAAPCQLCGLRAGVALGPLRRRLVVRLAVCQVLLCDGGDQRVVCRRNRGEAAAGGCGLQRLAGQRAARMLLHALD